MTVRALRRGTMAGRGAPAGGTFTLYPTADGRLYSSRSNDYASARAGFGVSADTTSAEYWLGQEKFNLLRNIFEGFFAFDTSSVVGTISSVVLSFSSPQDQSTPDFTLEARLYDWGAALAADDWVPGANLAALPLLASKTTVGWATSGYNDLVSEAAFAANINQSGTTRIVVVSSRLTVGNDPTGLEAVQLHSMNATADKRPKLVIVTT